MYVILKMVVKVSFICIVMWLVEENKEKKKKGRQKPAYVCALKRNIPSCLTGNAQVISSLKIGRIYLVT